MIDLRLRPLILIITLLMPISNISANEQRIEIIGHFGEVTGITFPNGKILSSSSDLPYLVLWDLGNGNNYNEQYLDIHEVGVTSLKYFNSSSKVISGDIDGIVNYWDFNSMSVERSISLEDEYVVQGYENQENFTLITDKGNIYDWNLENNIIQPVVNTNITDLQNIVQIDDRMYLISDRSITLLNSSDYSQINHYQTDPFVTSSYYDYINHQLIVGYDNRSVIVYNESLDNIIARFNFQSSVTEMIWISSISSFILGYRNGSVSTWNLNNQKNSLISNMNSEVTTLSSNNNMIGVGYDNGSIILYSLTNNTTQKLGSLITDNSINLTPFDILLTILSIMTFLLPTIIIFYFIRKRLKKSKIANEANNETYPKP